MFASINPFTPLVKKAKEAWAKVKSWWSSHSPGMFKGAQDAFGQIFSGVGSSKHLEEAKSQAKSAGKFITKVFKDISKFIGKVWDLIGPDVKKIGSGIWNGLKSIWNEVGPELVKFKKLWKPLGKAIQNLWTLAKPLLIALSLSFLFVGKILLNIISEVIGPALKYIGKILGDALQIIRGIFEVIIGILSGDWKLAWEGVKDIVIGIITGLWHIIQGVFDIILNVIQGFVKGIWGFFKWLWNILFGHSIIPDLIKAFFFWFMKLAKLAVWVWEHVAKPIWERLKKLWNNLIKPLLKVLVAGFFAMFKPLWTIAKWIWDHILQPLWERFKTGWDKITGIVKDAKDFIVEKFGDMKSKATDFIGYIKDLPGKIKDLAGDFKDAGLAIITSLWEGMKNAGTVIKDIAGSIYDAISGRINAGIDIINDKIPNSIGKGPLKLDLPDNPFPHLPAFFKGGLVRGTKYGTPILAGDRYNDEWVIPRTGQYAPKPQKGFSPGSMAPITKNQTFNFYGDLSFPNVQSGDDVETLISNLESLAG